MIISFDASTTSTGYAIFDNGVLVEYGAIRPKGDIDERIKQIYLEIKEKFQKHKFEYVFIEDVPLSSRVNRRVAEKLLLLQGTVYTLCLEHECEFIQMEPTNWRKLSGIKSKKRDLQKEEAIMAVNEKFGLNYEWVDSKFDSKTGNSDVCEAILIGLAGMIKRGLYEVK